MNRLPPQAADLTEAVQAVIKPVCMLLSCQIHQKTDGAVKEVFAGDHNVLPPGLRDIFHIIVRSLDQRDTVEAQSGLTGFRIIAVKIAVLQGIGSDGQFRNCLQLATL